MVKKSSIAFLQHHKHAQDVVFEESAKYELTYFQGNNKKISHTLFLMEAYLTCQRMYMSLKSLIVMLLSKVMVVFAPFYACEL